MVADTKALDFLFWESESKALFQILYPLLLNATLAGATNAMDDLAVAGIGIDWALINTAAVKWVRGYTMDLVSRINNTTRTYLQDSIATWIESGAPLNVLVDQITPMFGAVRAEMIGVTEATRAFAEGNTVAWQESGLVAGSRWMTAEDELVCPVCSAKDGNVSALGDRENTPPAHVRCRCYLQPVLEKP